MDEYKAMGYLPTQTVKGGVLVDLGGKNADNAVFLEAHVDTLGGNCYRGKSKWQTCHFSTGRYECFLIMQKEKTVNFTRFSGTYQGTCQLLMPLST